MTRPAITTNWISGQGIILYKDLRDFELFRLVKKGLQPYSSDLGEPVLPPTNGEKKGFLQRAREILMGLVLSLEVLRKTRGKPTIPQSVPVPGDPNVLTLQKYLRDEQKEFQKAKELLRVKQSLKELQLKLEDVLRETRGEHIVFEDPTILAPNETFEEIELAFIDRIKDVKKLIKNIKEELSKESGNWADYTPRSQEEKKQIIKELLTYIYKVEEVNRLAGPAKIPVQMTTEQSPVKSPKKKLTPVQRHKEECRMVAKSLWKEYSDMTIADMIQRDEICHACEGKVYTEKTLRNWIKDLCPDPSPGRRAKK